MFLAKIILTVGAMAALVSCAPKARLELGRSGEIPDPAGIAISSDSAVPPQFEATILEGLKKHGFNLSARPSFRVQLSLSQLEGEVGLFAPEAQAKAVSAWTLSPARSRSIRTTRATLSLTETASGRVLFQAYANERSRNLKARPGEHLAEALVNQLQDLPTDGVPG